MNKQSEKNKEAWSYNAYEACIRNIGQPNEVAKDMKNRPKYYLRRYLELLGDVNDNNIINILGSSGKKAIPLSILGADVTVVDISEENKKYAMEVAANANVNINYIVSDFLELDMSKMSESFDMALAEGGILHYFSDLNEFATRVHSMLMYGGKLILNDFHPIRKIFSVRDVLDEKFDRTETTGDYFESEVQFGDVPYKKILNPQGDDNYPKCLLRYWTMGEIITAFAQAGFVVEKLIEGPRYDEHKNIPGDFTLVVAKY